MRPRHFPIWTAISLLFCVGIIALWIRSYYVCDVCVLDLKRAPKPGWQAQWALASRMGCVDFGRIEYTLGKSLTGLNNYLFVTSTYGRSGVSTYHVPKPDDEVYLSGWMRDDYIWRHLGFASQREINIHMEDMGQVISPDIHGWHVTFPYWAVLFLAAIPPTLQCIAIFRSRRRAGRGLCPTCAYDLRAHKPGDKCPECGTSIASPETPAKTA